MRCAGLAERCFCAFRTWTKKWRHSAACRSKRCASQPSQKRGSWRRGWSPPSARSSSPARLHYFSASLSSTMTRARRRAMEIPREYNAAVDLIGRNLAAGRGAKTAYVDDSGSCTFAQLAERVDRAANALRSLGIRREERVAIAMLDSVDWVAMFLGAIKAGIVPVALNTLLTSADYAYQMKDSGAKALFVSDALLKNFESIAQTLEHVVPQSQLSVLLQKQDATAKPAPTTRDDICFWLYSSGSTGAPKGTVHLHSHLILTAELYAKPVLGIRESDVVF